MPACGWKKAEIIDWLVSRGEGGELNNLIIPELLKLSKKYEVPKENIVNAYSLY